MYHIFDTLAHTTILLYCVQFENDTTLIALVNQASILRIGDFWPIFGVKQDQMNLDLWPREKAIYSHNAMLQGPPYVLGETNHWFSDLRKIACPKIYGGPCTNNAIKCYKRPYNASHGNSVP